MRRILIFSFLTVFIVGFARGRVLADLSCNLDASCFINIDADHGGWSLFTGPVAIKHNDIYTGLTNAMFENGDPYYNAGDLSDGDVLTAHHVLDTPCVLDEYKINVAPTVTDLYFSLDVRRGEAWETLYSNYQFPPTLFGFNGTVGGDPVDEIQIQLASSDAGSHVTSVYFSSTDDCGPPIPTLTRPLTTEDEVETSPLYDTTKIANLTQGFLHEFNIYDVLHTGGPETVHAWSKAPGASVHSADAGSIASVKPLSWEDCGIGQYWPHLEGTDVTGADFYDFPAAQNQPCVVELYDTSVIGDVADIPWEGYSDESSVYKHRYWLDATNVYIVTLQIGDGSKIQYLVRNAPLYVLVGDTVEAGCVLGETIPLTTIPTQAVNFGRLSAGAGAIAFFVGAPISWIAGAAAVVANLAGVTIQGATPDSTTMGYTTLSLYDSEDAIQELAGQLTIEPTNDDKCNATGAYKDCLAENPQFTNNGDGWVASGNVEWTEPGVVLDPGESVNKLIPLLSGSDYTATAYAQGVDGAPGQIRLFLGSHTDTYDAPLEWTSLQLAAEPIGEPDAGSFYTIGIQNIGAAPIEVKSLCVTDGAPNLGPNSCYFNNHSFVNGDSGWDTTEGVEVADQALNVPDDGVISQNVMLNPLPGGPAIYKLVVRGDWWYTGALDTVSSASAIAQVQYEWPAGSGYQNMTPVTIKANLAYGGGQLAYIANISVSATTDDVMNIKVSTTTAGDMDVQGIRITDACLSTTGGGGFPGQGGGSAPPPLNANCEYVSRPQNNDPAAWLQWHWAMSNQFFRCDLLVLLNKMYRLGQQSYALAGWEARYMQTTMRMYSEWAGKQLFPWFDGHFRNIATGRVTTIYESGGGSCSDLFCVLNNLITGILNPVTSIINTLLGIINTVVDLLLTVVVGVIGLGLSFLGRLISIFNQATGLLSGLIGAYNTATPITIEGMPTCTVDPESSLLCRWIWVMDNTAFGGRWGVLFTLLLSIFTIHLILWAIGEFRRAIVATAGSAEA